MADTVSIDKPLREHTEKIMNGIDAKTASLDALDTGKLKELIGTLEEKIEETNSFLNNVSKLEFLQKKYITLDKTDDNGLKEIVDLMTNTYITSIHPVLNEYGLTNDAIFDGALEDEFGVTKIYPDNSIAPVKREVKLFETYLRAKIYLIKNEYLALKVNQKLDNINEKKRKIKENITVMKKIKGDIERASGPKIIARSNEVFKRAIESSSRIYRDALEMYENKLKRYKLLKSSQGMFFKNIQDLIEFGLSEKEIKQIYSWDSLKDGEKLNTKFFNGNAEYNSIRETITQVRKAGNKQKEATLDFEKIYSAAKYDLKLSKEAERAYLHYLEVGKNAAMYVNNGFKQNDDVIGADFCKLNSLNNAIMHDEQILNGLNNEYGIISKQLL